MPSSLPKIAVILSLFAAATIPAAGCSAPTVTGCGKDTDCKGDRVCVQGECVAPASGGGTGGGVGGPGGGDGGGATSTGGGTGGGGGASLSEIGTWVDAPGACPTGATRYDIATAAQLEAATRGEGTHASDPADACYFIHNGVYTQSGSTLLMYVKKGGTSATARRVFVGESRTGVILHGRATIDTTASHVQLSNLTFDLTGYSQSGSFNTLTLLTGSDYRIDHVTFTGDCMTGLRGGHVEVDGADDVVVDSCTIEKFGQCYDGGGHEDHGVYLGSGTNLVVRNNDIRFNSSRGVQLNTQQGTYGTLAGITIERNRIHENGHFNYEDGVVMNAEGTGTISNVSITHNLIYANAYSGVRQAGAEFQNVSITKNTFFHNGTVGTSAGRSEANLDDVGSGANTTYAKNIMVAGNKVLNTCYDAQPRGFSVTDNVTQGTFPTGTSGNCVGTNLMLDPQFADAGARDFHAMNPAVSGYGAYAP